jgi:hypothetical protein
MGLFGRGRDDDDEMDEWAYELTRKDSFPLVATIVGSIVILVVSVVLNMFASHRHILVTTLGAGMIVALLVWGVAFLITLRRAEIGWKIGSFVAMIVVGLVAGVIGIGTAITAMQNDIGAIADVKINQSFGLELPEGGARGPISKTTFAYLRVVVDDAMKHREALQALGYDGMASPFALKQRAGLLSHCDQKATVTPMIEAYYARRRAAFDKWQTDLSAIDMDENFRKGFADAGNKTHGRVVDMLQRAATNEHAQIGEMAAMCQILARHHWAEQFGHFAFSSATDLRDFNAHARREEDLSAESTALMRDSLATMESGQAMIRRGLF